MRRFTTLLILCYTVSLPAQKNCAIKPSDLIPLPDLQGKTYRGFAGGLYSNGSNQRPAAHLAEINEQVAKIKPLNIQGQSDPKGKVVMIGVGASNPRTEFENFKLRCAASINLNPQLVLVNTCVGGQGVQKMNTPEDNYWQNAASALKSNGLSDQQVQLAWVETDNTQTGDTLFPRAPLQLMEDYRLLLEVLHDKYPNLKVVYFSARAYAGYATPVPGGVGKGLLFPRDYLSGWAIKWLIENATAQKPGFVTKGTQANIPYVTWGSYHWSNAGQPRSDGFVLNCSTDVGEDGLHLTRLGEEKIGQLMFDYFQKDPTARTWLLQSTTTVTYNEAVILPTIQVYPNPFVDKIVLQISTSLREVSLTLRNLQGVALWQETRDLHGETVLNSLPNLPAGLYLLECRQGNKREVRKILKQR